MKMLQQEIEVSTRGQGLYEITDFVARFLETSNVTTGVVTLFLRHTSASLTIQENADPTVQSDLTRAFDRLVPENSSEGNHLYDHTCEGSDDMPAHIKTTLTDISLTIPVANGRMVLGTWQGIYVFEHRKSPHRRKIFCHLMGQ